MAQITLQIGANSGIVTANNTKAQAVLNNFILAMNYSGPNTTQAKLDFVAQQLAKYLTYTARRYQAGVQSSVVADAAYIEAANAFED